GPSGRAIDVVLDAVAVRFTDGYGAAAPLLTRALATIRGIDAGAEDVGRLLWLGGNRLSAIIATAVWDFRAARDLAGRQVRLARDTGALVQLQFGLNLLASNELLAGNLAAAATLVDEDRVVADATGNPPVGYAASLLAALRGRDPA